MSSTCCSRRAVAKTVAITAILAGALLGAACSSSGSSSSSASETSKTAGPTTTTSLVSIPAGTPVAVVASAPSQTISAFGASGAWWPIDLAQFPKSVQAEVAKDLFTTGGIALSGYRYNIGGGGAGVTSANRAPRQVPADAAGRAFLRDANAARVPVLTGFVNSAPPPYTTNHKACAGQLIPGRETAFAQYLSRVVRLIHDQDRVTLQYVSPMNEPDDSFSDCGQEGMAVPIAQRAPMVEALGRALAHDAPFARVIADETTADAILSTEAPQWLTPAAPYLAAIAHHTYDFPNDAIRALVPPISRQFGKPTWMTEICCYKGSGGVATSFGANYDPTITQGLWLADQIYDDFVVAHDSAWYWWTALSSVIGCDPHADPACPSRVNTKGFNDGLLYYDPKFASNGDTKIFTTKRFFTLGQFSKYVRPGAVLHVVTATPPGVRALAFAQPNGWTVVTWNEQSTSQTFAVSLAGTTAVRAAVATSATDELTATAGPARAADGRWLVTLPPKTIATYTFAATAHN